MKQEPTGEPQGSGGIPVLQGREDVNDLNQLSRAIVLDHLTYPINPAEYLPRPVCEQISPEDWGTLSALCVGLLAWVRSQVAEQLDLPENGDTQ